MYTGYTMVKPSDEDLNAIYNGSYTNDFLKENEYFIVTDENGDPTDYFRARDKKLIKLRYPTLGNDFMGYIKPRNPQQYCAMDLLKNDIPVKVVSGKFGTGKSFLCCAAAMNAIDSGKVDKIVYVRNNIQVKNTDNIGALPGSMEEKLAPYVAPFADHCGGFDGVYDLMNKGQFEIVPLGFLRGRSLKHCIIYCTEAENLTKEHIQLLLGRVDEGSQLWLDGDVKQRDREAFERSPGLETLIERLKGDTHFGYVNLVKTERSEVAALADKLD